MLFTREKFRSSSYRRFLSWLLRHVLNKHFVLPTPTAYVFSSIQVLLHLLPHKQTRKRLFNNVLWHEENMSAVSTDQIMNWARRGRQLFCVAAAKIKGRNRSRWPLIKIYFQRLELLFLSFAFRCEQTLCNRFIIITIIVQHLWFSTRSFVVLKKVFSDKFTTFCQSSAPRKLRQRCTQEKARSGAWKKL